MDRAAPPVRRLAGAVASILALTAVLACVPSPTGELADWLRATEVAEMEPRVRLIAAHGTRNEKLTVVGYLGTLHQGEREDPAAADLVALFLDDDDTEVLRTAVHNVGYLGGRRHVGRVAAFLDHGDASVRNLAAASLAMLAGPGDERYLPRLVELLGDEAVLVRMSAIEAIRAIGHPSSVAPLLAILPAEQRAVQREIVLTLAHLGDPIALPTLGALLRSLEGEPDPLVVSGFRDSDPTPSTLRRTIREAMRSLEDSGEPATGPR